MLPAGGMMTTPGGARFTVYAGFRRGRLVLMRGLPSLERAIEFAESVTSLRFRNREPIFVVDDATREEASKALAELAGL